MPLVLRDPGSLAAFSTALLLIHGTGRDRGMPKAWSAVMERLFPGQAISLGEMDGRTLIRRQAVGKADEFTAMLLGLLQQHLDARALGQRWPADATLTAIETGPAIRRSGRAHGLTPRECDVLILVAEGRRDAEIAKTFDLAVRTVSKHVERILAKLGVETRASAAREAMAWIAGAHAGPARSRAASRSNPRSGAQVVRRRPSGPPRHV